jgi:predicted acyl esterase
MAKVPTARGPLGPGIKLEEDIYVKMRDGVKLAVDIYRPAAEGRYPVLLSMSPYPKEIQLWPPVLTHMIEAGNTNFFVSKGYIHVIAQIRGCCLSQGQYNLFDLKEQQDGYDLIEWCAKQPWSDGNVGMMGDSYFAMIQYLVAAQQPPHLKCIAPYDGTVDIYHDFTYPGGVFFAWFAGMWCTDVLTTCAFPEKVEGRLPPANFLGDIAAHTKDGPYYWERSARTKLDKIKVPVLNMVPQRSIVHSKGQLYAYTQIKTPQKLLVMPFCALSQHELFITSPSLNEYLLRWYDHWLKGKDTGIMKEPEVAIFDTGTQKWRYENEYPLGRTQWTKFHLRKGPGGPATQPPFGLLSLESPAKEEPDSYTRPEAIGTVMKGKPVIAFNSSPLEKDVTVWGPLSAVIYGSSTSLDIAWFVKLADTGSDGSITPLTVGQLKASHREVDPAQSKPGRPFHPCQNPVRPEPNKVYEYQIEIMPLFHTFKAGHRISIQISNDDLWFQEHVRTVYISETVPVPSKQTIYHDAANPSFLLLPVIPEGAEVKPMGPPISQIKWPV